MYILHPISNDILTKLYRVFVLPILDYCNVVWTPSLATTHFKRLERLHPKFSNLSSNVSSSMNITLTEQRRYHTAMQVYRVLHKMSPSYLDLHAYSVYDTFHYAVDITSCVARNAHCLLCQELDLHVH